MQTLAMFGPLDTILAPIIPFVVLGLLVANMVTRVLAHRSYVKQNNEGGAESITRSTVHTATTFLLILATFYYLTVDSYAGLVSGVLILGMVVSDFFEFEARLVEARREVPLDTPKSAIAASVLALLYVAFQTLFFIVEPFWQAIVG
ncbi:MULTISPECIES: hypothetical protein [unclassified Haladaptatus]|uniref:DUF7313 family protein n=2 Tax=Haladaptatus TaxID=367188 RepID=UPI0023E7CDA0|nr:MULTISPECIES: hypothetical protein [unclassified Haladaptatus]